MTNTETAIAVACLLGIVGCVVAIAVIVRRQWP